MKGIALAAQACLEAWISCENLLAEASRRNQVPQGIAAALDQCALICMETWQALKDGSVQARKMMLLCIGVCEDCADACSQYPRDAWLAQCSRACRRCASRLAPVAIQSALYQ